MIKADDKVKFDEAEKPEKFTNFEELAVRVSILQELVDKHATILRQNNLIQTTTEDAPYFEEDEVYDRLI